MDLHLKDKVVIVTGGAKGIGAAIVRACAAEGAVPVIVDRDRESGQRLQNELKASGASCGLINIDLESSEGCSHSIEQTLLTFGRIDALVNNAGRNDKVGLEKGSPSEYVASLHRNLVHYYSMAHYALPHLKRSRGAIVNIGSKTAVTGQGDTSGYASSKGAIMALTREWAAELLPCGIRVNTVMPAEVMTPLYRDWLDTFPDPDQDSSGPPHDHSGRNQRDGDISDFRQIEPYHGPAFICRWRLRSFGSRLDVKTQMPASSPSIEAA